MRPTLQTSCIAMKYAYIGFCTVNSVVIFLKYTFELVLNTARIALKGVPSESSIEKALNNGFYTWLTWSSLVVVSKW